MKEVKTTAMIFVYSCKNPFLLPRLFDAIFTSNLDAKRICYSLMICQIPSPSSLLGIHFAIPNLSADGLLDL